MPLNCSLPRWLGPAFAALLVVGVMATLSWPTGRVDAAAGSSPTSDVPARALERDRLRARQSLPPPTLSAARTTARSTAAASASTSVPAGLVGLALADLTVGPGSTLDKAQQSGVGWMLGWISWQNLEPVEGQFAWNQGTGNDVDNLIRAGQSANLQILARLQNVPAWATSDGSGRLAAVRPDALSTFGQALAAHTAGRVGAFEIFNEPNLNYEWGQDLDASGPAGYAALLRAAYPGIKTGDPNAVVVSAGLADSASGQSMDDLQYLRGLYSAGARGGTHFDALGTHPYGGSYPPEQDPSCGGTCLRRAELQRQIMLDHGDSATPMWATEVGWLLDSPNDMGPYFNWMKVSAQQQADYLSGAMHYARANWPWMQRMFVFNLDHSTAMWCGGACYPPTTSVHWFSILNPDRTPRLAYTALQNLMHGVTPTPTSTPTATSTPVVISNQTITFDDLANAGRALGGQYPTGTIDWGSGAWYLSRPWGQFGTNSISFNGAALTSATFTLVAPRRVVQIDAFNGGTVSSTISLSCAGQPPVSTVLAANQLRTLVTNWSGPCTTVTVSSSNGWDTNFDNLVIQ